MDSTSKRAVMVVAGILLVGIIGAFLLLNDGEQVRNVGATATANSPAGDDVDVAQGFTAGDAAVPVSLNVGGGANDHGELPSSDVPAAQEGKEGGIPTTQVWDSLYGTLDSLITGTMTQEALTNLGLDLVSLVNPQAQPEVIKEGELVAYELLNSPELGTVKLYVTLDPTKKKETTHDFEVKASLYTRPGAYTGLALDNATTSTLSFTLNLDGSGAPATMGALCQNRVHGTRDLWNSLKLRTGAAAVGGAFAVDGEGARWYQATLEASGTEERPSFVNLSSGPASMPGGIADPRVDVIATALKGLRKTPNR